MRKSIQIVVTLVVTGLFLGSAVQQAAAFTENFEGIGNTDPLTTGNWDGQDHASFIVRNNIGFGGSKGALHDSAASNFFANAWRNDVAGNQLTGRLYLSDTVAGSIALLGLSPTVPTANVAGGADQVYFLLRDRLAASDYRLFFSGSGTELIAGAITNDTWYDVKMEVNPAGSAYTAAGWYKLSSSPTWISMGSGTTTTVFAPTYAVVGALKQGVVDDVESIPEPSAIILFSLGMLGLVSYRRRK